ncbi:MAG TPA: hypothetical protein VGN61_07625 [Verrucomicrobiae bacterium]
MDYVNLGAFGTSLDISDVLTLEGGADEPNPWNVGGATDMPNSPMYPGLLNQIVTGEAADPLYYGNLNGSSPSSPGSIFGADYNPSNAMVQTGLWQPINPRVHYTLQDLTAFGYPSLSVKPIDALFLPLTNNLYLRKPAPYYNSGLVKNESLESQNGEFQIQFPGVVDMPYAIWSSSDLQNWSQIGVAAQPTPGNFQFTDTTSTNSSSRVYEVRLP